MTIGGLNMNKNSYGLQINKDVISQIAATAAAEVPNVVGVASAPLSKKINIKNPINNSGTVVKTDNGAIIIDIYINVSVNGKVRVVAEEVQRNVKEKVQTMTSNPVAAVNVYIVDVVEESNDEIIPE